MRRFLPLCAGLLLVPLAPAADPPKAVVPPTPAATPAPAKGTAPAPAKGADDSQTLVYLGRPRPVLLRMHVLIDGKPYSAAWDEFMKKLFDYLDVNGDGTLSREEAGRVPTVQMLRNHYLGIIAINAGGGNVAPFAELDANKDGKVTRDELKAYYRRQGLGSFQVRGASSQGQSGALTEALFKYLDTNHDGKLSREELAAAGEVLHRLDIDEDEMISQEELVPSTNPYGQVFFGVVDTGMGQKVTGPFEVLGPGEAPAKAVKALLDHFDKDKNGKLSRSESGFDEATFARLDINKDGQLDAGELQKWLAGPSDLELTVRLGGLPRRKQPGGLLRAVVNASPAPNAAVEVVPGKDWPLAASAKTEGQAVVLTHGIARIDVRGSDTLGRFGGARGFYLQQFKMALKDKKDYLEKKDLDNNGNNQFLRGLFTFADRNGDGKLTEKELTAFFDAIDGGASASVSLSVSDHGPGLFELLDANRDGRLSIRELRTAWERVAPWDKANSGAVSRDQIPRQYSLTVRQGTVDDRRFRVAIRQGGMRPQTANSGRGPLWFRKMDRNGDGDVSPREWLGSAEDFKKIDTDGDGLISADEAQKADAWFREKMRAKEKK
jgi:Ca2+-binding EF-hand superfamily protein